MHKLRIAALLTLALLLAASVAGAEVTLRLNGLDARYTGDFAVQHPEVSLADDAYTYYATTGELSAALQSDGFGYDTFELCSAWVDVCAIMAQGYCLDLSGSEAIRSAVESLHPVFAAQCVLDGKIYAVPHTLQLNYLSLSSETMAQSGLGDLPCPATYPEFLDFLEAWLTHLEAHPDGSTALLGRAYWGDGSFYHSDSYTAFLVDLLLENYLMQREYAGENTWFDPDVLVPLLERSRRIGQALYQADPGIRGDASLVEIGAPTSLGEDSLLNLRLTENQPRLISTYVTLIAAYADTPQPALCLELMEALCRNNWPLFNTLLYQGTQPLPDPQYGSHVARLTQMVQTTQAQLADSTLDAAARADLESRLAKQQSSLQDYLENEDRQYLVTAAELARFRENVDCLFVQSPGIFHANDVKNAAVYKSLKARFAAGELSAEDLVRELNAAAARITSALN